MRIVHLPVLTAIFVFLLLIAPTASAVNYSPATETQTTGTRTAGMFPASIQTSDDDRAVYTEAIGATPTDTVTSGAEIFDGDFIGGSFPDCVATADDVRCTYSGAVTGGSFPQVMTSAIDFAPPSAPFETTSHVLDLPSGIVSGNLLVMTFTTAGGSATHSWPAGWTEMFEKNSGDHRNSYAYRIADGGEGATITITTSGLTASRSAAYRIGGWHGTTPPELAFGPAGSSANPDPPNLAPTWGLAGRPTTWIATYSWKQASGINHVSYPASFTSNQLVANPASEFTGLAIATFESAVASLNPGTATISGATTWIAETIAVRGIETYGFNMEYHWSGLDAADTTRQLRLECSRTGNDFDVQVHTPPSTWNSRLACDTITSSEVLQTYSLTSAEWDSGAPDVRFFLEDSPQSDVLRIDLAIMRTGVNLYGLEIRYDWSGASNAENIVYRLRVEAQSDSSHEVQVLTPPSTWNTRLTFDGVSDVSQTYTLTAAEHASGSVSIRFVETTEDETQDTFSVDFARVEGSGSQSLETGVSSLWILVFIVMMVVILGAAWWFKER